MDEPTTRAPVRNRRPHTLDRRRIDAVIFDTDGVLTATAEVHASAWKQVFDEFLEQWTERTGTTYRPFDQHEEYLRFVDGKPRRDGVQAFLEARGLLQETRSDDIDEIAAAKDKAFTEAIADRGVEVYPSTRSVLESFRSRGFALAAVSASRHARQVLETAGLTDLLDVIVDGEDARDLHLPGKPDPALFQEAARRLGVPSRRAAVVEDAVAGVEAGRRGIFGFVVGVERSGDERQRDEMRRVGVDALVGDLTDVEVGDG